MLTVKILILVRDIQQNNVAPAVQGILHQIINFL